MITKTCDNCDKPIEVADDKAGQKVACPKCGDINRIPGSEAPASDRSSPPPKPPKPKDRAELAGYPPDSGPEQRVLTVHPAMFRAHPFSFLGLIVAVLAGATGAIYFGLIEVHKFGWIASLVVLLAALLVFGVWKLKTISVRLLITNKRTVIRRGLISRNTSEVLHDNIRNVQIDQSAWDRICGVGVIGLSSAGQDGLEIEVKDMPKPLKVREIIDLYRPLGD